MVTVNLTSRCEQKCIYCEIGQGITSDRGDNLSPDDLKWIIDEMALNRIRKISLCGGEPFLFPGLIEVVEYAGTKGIRCSITTNGMKAYRLNDQDLDILSQSRAEINISVDSFDESTEAITRGTLDALDRSLKSIKRLLNSGIPVTLLTAISRHNYRELHSHTVRACEMGIRQVLFQPLIFVSNYPDRRPVGKKHELNVPVPDIGTLINQLRKIHRYEKTHPVRTNVYRILPWIKNYIEYSWHGNGGWFFHQILKKFYCREVDAIIDITYDGGIQPCGLALSSTTIHEDRHLGLVGQWEKATQQLREELAQDQFRDICNGCCHHFSRNMLASVLKYPVQNWTALRVILPLVLSRTLFTVYKNTVHLS